MTKVANAVAAAKTWWPHIPAFFRKISRHLPSGVLVLLAYSLAWFSANSIKIYWTDEIFSLWTTGNDSLGLGETLRLAGSGRDGMMPLFYVTGNLWAWFGGLIGLGGSRELWMRIPSLLWTVSGFGILYVAMRRRHGAAAAGMGLALGLLCTIGATAEMTWFRAYAAMCGLTAMMVAAAGIKEFRARVAAFYLLNALVCLFHPYGILYGGAVTSVAAFFTWVRGGWRQSLAFVGSLVFPFLAMLFKIGHLRAVSGLGGEGGMWEPPRIDGLVLAMAPFGNPTVVCFLFLILGGLGIFFGRRAVEGRWRGVADFEFCAAALLAVPVFVWTASHWSSFFLIRYFCPVAVFVCVAGSLVFSRLLSGAAGRILAFAGVSLVCFLHLSANSVVGAAREAVERQLAVARGELDGRVFSGKDGKALPLIMEDLDMFLPRAFYNPAGEYYFPVRDIPPREPAAKIKTLSQNLVLAHVKSYTETGGRVGLNPERVLDAAKLRELMGRFDAVFVVKNAEKGTGGFVDEELRRAGWTPSPFAQPGIFVWQKKTPEGK